MPSCGTGLAKIPGCYCASAAAFPCSHPLLVMHWFLSCKPINIRGKPARNHPNPKEKKKSRETSFQWKCVSKASWGAAEIKSNPSPLPAPLTQGRALILLWTAIPGFGITAVMGFRCLPGGGGGCVCSALLLPHTPFFGAVKETKNKSKRGTSQHLGKLKNGFVLENCSRKTLTCPGHGRATKSMAGRELGWAGAEEEEDIPEIPASPRDELSVLGQAVQAALGSPGVWVGLSGEFLGFRVAPPWCGSAIFSMDASWNQAGGCHSLCWGFLS